MTEIVFQRTLVRPKGRGPARRAPLIENGDQLRESFERAQRHPMWKRDPRLARISPRASKEIQTLYNAVVADGRYVSTFIEDPGRAARELNIRISDINLERIRVVGSGLGDSASSAGAIAVISISVVAAAVVTAIVSSAADPRGRVVIDESGIMKV